MVIHVGKLIEMSNKKKVKIKKNQRSMFGSNRNLKSFSEEDEAEFHEP